MNTLSVLFIGVFNGNYILRIVHECCALANKMNDLRCGLYALDRLDAPMNKLAHFNPDEGTKRAIDVF